MRQMKPTFILLSLWTMVALLNIISTTNIKWTKFAYDDTSNGFSCTSSENHFVRDVPDLLTCSKSCFLHNECYTAVYRPDIFQCIGCTEFSYQPLLGAENLIQLSRTDFYVDCKEIFEKNKFAKTGIFRIRLPTSERIDVRCDMATDGGGWTVYQNRFDGSVDFNRTFADYESGFGELNGEFWLGLRYLKQFTNTPHEIIDSFARINYSRSDSKHENALHMTGKYDLLVDYNPLKPDMPGPVMPFYTYDQDNLYNCAKARGGGWWFVNLSSCGVETLNDGSERFFNRFSSSTMLIRRK